MALRSLLPYVYRPVAESVEIEARWEWDVLKDRVTWSAELYEIYGLEPREFRPSYDAYLQRVHPADRNASN